jgi:ribonuclease E
VRLPSGGAIVIDHTEALVSVDVNSGRATRGSDIEHTAFNTNIEAAEEVARQLRLRDLGGLVVIDFIDMESQRNQREVENALRDALHADRARVETGKISRFGLLELSRQRLRPSLGETNHIPCPRCHGTGHIRGIESTALHILRITQEDAMKENSAIIQVQLPVEVATFLLNEKRADIHKIEQRMGVEVVLIPNIHLETPNYNITRVKHDDVTEETSRASYKLVELPTETTYIPNAAEEAKAVRPVAAVKGITPAAPAPIVAEKVVAEKTEPKLSLFARIKNFFSAPSTESESQKVEAEKANAARSESNRNNRNRNRNRNERNRNERGEKNERTDKATNQERPNRNQDAKAQEARPAEGKQQEPRQQKPQQARTETQRNEPARNQQTKAPVEATGNETVEQTTERGSRRNRNNRRGRRDRDDSAVREGNLPFVPNEEISANQANVSAEASVQAPAKSDNKAESVTQVVETKTNDASNQGAPVVEVTAAEKNTPTGAKKARGQKNAPNKASSAKRDNTEAVVEINADVNVATTAEVNEGVAAKTDKKRPARPRKAKAETKPVDLAASGLQLVETKADAPKASAPVESKEPRAPRKAATWQKQAKADATAEPLVMVETQNK